MAGTRKGTQKVLASNALMRGRVETVELTSAEATTLAAATAGGLADALTAAVAAKGLPKEVRSSVLLVISS